MAPAQPEALGPEMSDKKKRTSDYWTWAEILAHLRHRRARLSRLPTLEADGRPRQPDRTGVRYRVTLLGIVCSLRPSTTDSVTSQGARRLNIRALVGILRI